MAWISFGALPCRGKKNLYDSSRLDVVEIVRPWHASELVSFLVGLRTYQHPGTPKIEILICCVFFFCTDVPDFRSRWPCGLSLRTLGCCDCGFESHRWHGFLCVVSAMCCEVDFFTDLSSREVLPTAVHRCLWSRDLVNEEVMSYLGLLRPKQNRTRRHCVIICLLFILVPRDVNSSFHMRNYAHTLLSGFQFSHPCKVSGVIWA